MLPYKLIEGRIISVTIYNTKYLLLNISIKVPFFRLNHIIRSLRLNEQQDAPSQYIKRVTSTSFIDDNHTSFYHQMSFLLEVCVLSARVSTEFIYFSIKDYFLKINIELTYSEKCYWKEKTKWAQTSTWLYCTFTNNLVLTVFNIQ